MSLTNDCKIYLETTFPIGIIRRRNAGRIRNKYKINEPGDPDLDMLLFFMFYFEVKDKETKDKLSDLQIKRREEIIKAGGYYFIIECFDDIIKSANEVKRILNDRLRKTIKSI